MSFLFLNNNKWTFFVFSVWNVKYLIFYTYDLLLQNYPGWMWGYVWKAKRSTLDLEWKIGMWINEKKS